MKIRFDPRNLTIGALLTLGIFLIIGLIISASFYSNFLSNSAQNIIQKSTSRMFDVLTIQRDTEELFSALSEVEVIQSRNELEKQKINTSQLYNRAKDTISEGRENNIFSETEYEKANKVLIEIYDTSSRIFTLKEQSINNLKKTDESENNNFNNISPIDEEFSKLRHVRFEMLEVFNEIVIRSDDEHRTAMNLVQRAQTITWVVIGISLTLSLVLGVFLIRSVKKIFDMKNEFVNIIAHDLRNPVTAIIGYLELFDSQKDKKISDLKDNFQALMVSAQKLRTQISNLLEVGRTEAGKPKINLESVSPSKVIEESVIRARAFAQMSGIKIIYKKAEQKDILVEADNSKLSDVLDNLISNAIKYNSKKGTVFITTKESSETFSISVRDTGDGIPENQKHKIFKRYSRLDTDKEKKVRGTGLGLYTVKLAIDQMKGKVEFESKKGEGTTFTIYLKKTKRN